MARRRRVGGYRVISSFGAKVLSSHRTLSAARKSAARRRVPVDVWSTTGGHFGVGKVVAHYGGSTSNPQGTPRDIPSKWTPAKVARLRDGRIQIRIPGGRR